MIVDDSPVARAVLSRMISAHRDLEVVALAGNARDAIDALKAVKIDIVDGTQITTTVDGVLTPSEQSEIKE